MFHSPLLDLKDLQEQRQYLQSGKLSRNFYTRNTLEVLSDCLGKLVVSDQHGILTVGRITEAEAYLGHEDKAAHSYKGRHTPRTAIMFAEGGHSYVFVVHTHMQFNIVTETTGIPQAILIRGIEPILGIDNMTQRRQNEDIFSLGTGPGKLTKSLGITKDLHYGIDLTRSNELFLADDGYTLKEEEIIKTTRVGIDYAEEYVKKPWRYYIKGSKFISRK